MPKAAAPPKPPETLSRFKIGDKEYEIDVAKLTLGELSEIEEHFDRDFDSLHKGQDLIARLYLAQKRRKASTTWEDVEGLGDGGFEQVDVTRPTSPPATSGTPAN